MIIKHVLIIGKSVVVLDTAAALLRERGYDVDTTDDFNDVASRFDLRQFDLITTGGQVPVEKRAEIRHDARARKADMLFVQGLAGIPGLLVQQIEGEFAAQYRDGEHTPVYDALTRTIKLSLTEPAAVKLVAWWMTSFIPPTPMSDSRVLTNERMTAGDHVLSLPAFIPEDASFVTIQIGKAGYSLSLTDASR